MAVETAPRPRITPVRDVIAVFRIALVAVLGGLAVAYVRAPGLREWLTAEDGLTEWLTAATFLSAALIGVWAMRRDHDLPRVLWLIPVGAGLGFLDEISYGARLFDFEMPTIAGVTFDSLHDIVDVIEAVAADVGIGRAPLGILGMAVLGIAAFAVIRAGAHVRVAEFFRTYRAALYASAAVVIAGAGLVTDLLGRSPHMRLVEELLELTAAGLFVMAALSLPDPATTASGWRRRLWQWIGEDGPDRRATS